MRIFYPITLFGVLILSGCDIQSLEKPWIGPQSEQVPLFEKSAESSAVPVDSSPATLNLPPLEKNLKVAILLPLTGPQAASVSWIAKGLEDHLDCADPDTRPTFWFVDTQTETKSQIRTAFENAKAQGANWFIGPLTKNGVQQALAWQDLPQPVLLLNYTPDSPKASDPIYEFSLAPEDELQQMTQVLERTHAHILAPDDPNGHREAQALERYWKALEHPQPSISYYRRDPQHMTQVVQKLLGQPVTKQGKTQKPLEHITLSVQDVIFLLGRHSDAALIKPLLDFYGAASIPVIGTSSLAQANPNVAQEDLNGIIYCDMPPPDAVDPTLLKDSAYRLHAFGHDAWLIARIVFSDKTPSTGSWKGHTGFLKLNPNNHHVERHLICRQIRHGIAKPL